MEDVLEIARQIGRAGEATAHADDRDLVRTRSFHENASIRSAMRSVGDRLFEHPQLARVNHLDVAFPAIAQFVGQERAAQFGRDHAEAPATEMTLELGDHAHARPRAPDERDDAAGPATIEPEGQLVENLVRGSVIRLADIAEPPRNRGKEGRELEGITAYRAGSG